MNRSTLTAGARYLVFTLIFVLISRSGMTFAQDTSPVITADNIRQLQSVARLNFDELPPEAGDIDIGWFAMTPDGETYASINRAHGVVQWNLDTGYATTTYAVCHEGDEESPGSFIDGVFRPHSGGTGAQGDLFIAVYKNSIGYSIGYHPSDGDFVVVSCSDRPAIPIRVWTDESGHENWFEMFSQNATEMPYVYHHPVLFGLEGDPVEVEELPSAPENDPDSFLRIGRIDPPLAITVTQDGLAKRWNLEMGEATAQAQIDSLPATGRLNAAGSHLAWVDQDFSTLHLLNFETGEDTVVADLEDTYFPTLLLTPGADVIIGVNVDYQPIVVAWDVATGERIELGQYRACNRRQPDVVRLSADGSTLAIGCDTGLDIWRVVED